MRCPPYAVSGQLFWLGHVSMVDPHQTPGGPG